MIKRSICFIACFLFVSFIITAQKIYGDKIKLQNVLQMSHECNVEVESINEHLISKPSVRVFGVNSQNLVCNLPCIEISYIVEKDNNGSKYRRILYIPVDFLNRTSFTDDDFCYYEDRWMGGPRFDTQGGRFHPNATIKKILTLLYLK